MGIIGILPALAPSMRKANIGEFSGQRVAVDAYGWLHKGAYPCAKKMYSKEYTTGPKDYCLTRIRMLRRNGIWPVMVFDGANLPAKAVTEATRQKRRNDRRDKVQKFTDEGRANELTLSDYKGAIDIDHSMVLELMKQCQDENLCDCLVAPYEADAQMTYLNVKGVVSCVISEDGDLVLFGCTSIMYKMNVDGDGYLYEKTNLFKSMSSFPADFGFKDLVNLWFLSGCDYLESIRGIGKELAKKFALETYTTEISEALPLIPQYLGDRFVVDQSYIDSFIVALIALRHQVIFCPFERRQRRLHSPSETATDEQLAMAGSIAEPTLAFQRALGNAAPDSDKIIGTFNPDKS